LVGLSGASAGQAIPVGESVTLGRSPDNDVVLRELKASRCHARLECKGGSYFLEDLGSGNGTWINNRMIQKGMIRHADILRIGQSSFLFREPVDSEISESGVVFGEGSPLERTRFEVSWSEHRTAFSGEERAKRSLESVERLNHKLSVIYQVSNQVGGVHDLDELLMAILEAVFDVIPAERGAILLKDRSSGELVSRVVKSKEQKSRRDFVISSSILRRVEEGRRSLLTTDALADERFADSDSIISQGVQTAMSAPLICREEFLGVLHVDSTHRSDAFNEDNLDLLMGIAGQAAIALQNAQLIEQIEIETEARVHLQRYLRPDLVESIVNQEVSLDLGGTLKEVSILFADIRGFTRFSEELGPEETVLLLNEYFERIVDIVFSCGGALDKFIGDCVMAVWGNPIRHPDDALSCLQAAMRMQGTIFHLNSKLIAEGRPPLRLGIGVNTGKVISGNMGSVRRMEHTVIGPPVNLASRMEALSQADQILMSKETYAEVEGHVQVLRMDPQVVRGIQEKLSVYLCLGIRSSEADGESERWVYHVPSVLQGEGANSKLVAVLQSLLPGGFGGEFLVDDGGRVEVGDVYEVFLDIPLSQEERSFVVEVESREIVSRMLGRDLVSLRCRSSDTIPALIALAGKQPLLSSVSEVQR
jgi:adenylate cyclase